MEMEMEKHQEEEQWERIWIGFPGNAMHMWARPESNKASVPSRMLWLHAPWQSWGIIFYSGIKLFWLSLIISAFSLCLLWFFPCRRNANQITRNVCVCLRVGMRESLSSLPPSSFSDRFTTLGSWSASQRRWRRHLGPIFAMPCSAVSKIICLTIKDDKH